MRTRTITLTSTIIREAMKTLTLVRMKPDTKGRVVEVTGGPALMQRLMSMGIYPGTEIAKAGHFALKGPVMVKVGRATIALGHSMAEKIKVSVE